MTDFEELKKLKLITKSWEGRVRAEAMKQIEDEDMTEEEKEEFIINYMYDKLDEAFKKATGKGYWEFLDEELEEAIQKARKERLINEKYEKLEEAIEILKLCLKENRLDYVIKVCEKMIEIAKEIEELKNKNSLEV